MKQKIGLLVLYYLRFFAKLQLKKDKNYILEKDLHLDNYMLI